jgi:transcriptional regulator with XRE-family HTH domain
MILSDSDIGKSIRRIRHELGVTQEELAEQVKVTCRQLQRYEYGKNKLPIEQLQAIAQVLQVPVAHFFNEPEPVSGAASLPGLTPVEQRLLKQFRRIENVEVRELVSNVLRVAAEGATAKDEG